MHIKLSEFIKELQPCLNIGICSAKEFVERNKLTVKDVSTLYLELGGFFETLKSDNLQIINKEGINFFFAQDKAKRADNLSNIFSFNLPAILFTDGVEPDEEFMNLSEANSIPLLKTDVPSSVAVKMIEQKLDEMLSPRISYRGTMLEVYGIGVLLTGKSNIGKSECALELIQRGHRLIGDDMIEITKRSGKVLIASGKFPIAHRMELRGIGIIDIIELFGISAIKELEKIELLINLENWDANKSYERLGIDEKYINIMDIPIPYIELPVSPGRNMAILIEVAAMSCRLRKRGVIPAEELDRELSLIHI